ncbi:MAG: Ig-like domain-containing protein, partial [Nitrospiria bacterium]
MVHLPGIISSKGCLIYTFHTWAKVLILIFFAFIFFAAGCDLRGGKTDAPELSFTRIPDSGVKNVPINTTIQAVFQSPLDPQSVRSDLFILMDPAGNKVPVKLDYTASPGGATSTLTLTPLSYSQNPPSYLHTNSTYTVALGAGIKTQAGATQTVLNTWSFTTNNSTDFIPPAFNGLISAQGIDTGSVKLTWAPAVDNPGGTPSDQLIFSICFSPNSFTCPNRFVPMIKNPPATVDSNGMYSYTIRQLKPESSNYFVVRVEDLAGNRDPNTVAIKGTTLSGKLYVSNFRDNEILAFDHPSKLSGSNSATVRSIKASLNGLTKPYGMFYDQVHNRLYISTCQLSGSDTLVQTQVSVTCIPGTSKIAIYDNTSTLSGDQKPDRTIINSGLNGPVGLFLDSSGGFDTLYVANFAGKSVTIYNNITLACNFAPLVNGTCSLTPTRTIQDANLTAPFGIALDSLRNLLYVSNYVDVFNVNGSPPFSPGTNVAVFSGSGSAWTVLRTITGFNSPAGLWLDAPSDTLYVANAGANLGSSSSPTKYPGIVAICHVSLIPAGLLQSFPASTACAPGQAATQFLAGSKAAFVLPVQAALTYKMNNTTLYVSDYSGNTIEVFTPNPLFSSPTTTYNNT